MIHRALVRSILSPLVITISLFAQPIENYKLDKSAGLLTGTLIVQLRNRELSVSNRVIRVWDAWTPTRLIYSSLDPSAAENASQPQALRYYDTASLSSRTIAVENATITDITHVLLGTDSVAGDVGFVISMKDGKGVPWVALANEKSGVYRREQYAVPGAITKDLIEIRHVRPEDLAKVDGDFSRLPPTRTSTARLLPGDPSPVGTWVATGQSPGRKTVLIIRRGGSAELIVEDAKGQVKRPATWSQSELNLNVEFSTQPGTQPPAPITWDLKPSELIPKAWDRTEYGNIGLPMKRAGV